MIYVFFFIVLTGIFALVAMMNLREPWSDEAMLAYNFFNTEFSVFRPLPHYEQAAPIGYILAIRTAISGMETLDALQAMRIVSLAAFSLSILLLSFFFLKTRKWMAAALFFTIIFMNAWIWQYAVEIKHYSFEFLATCLIILSGQRYAKTHRISAAVAYFMICALAPFIAFTSPLVVVATSMSILALQMISRRGQTYAISTPKSKRLVVGTLILSILIAATFHVLVNREVVYFQFTAFTGDYISGVVNLKGPVIENIKVLSRLPEYALQSLGQSDVQLWLREHFADSFTLYASIAAGSFLVLTSILLLAFKSQPFIVVTTVVILFLAALLNIVGILPISAHRHFFFLSPLILVSSAFAGQRVFSVLSSLIPTHFRNALGMLSLIILGSLSVMGARDTLTRRSPEILPVFAEIRASDETARVWLYPSVQPISLIVAPENLSLLGILDNQSTEVSWEERGFPRSSDGTILRRDYVSSLGEAAENPAPLWLIFPIIAEFETAKYLSKVQALNKTCELHLRTNGTELYYCT